MELNKKNIKKILAIITFAIILFWGLQNLTVVTGLISTLLGLIAPFIMGLCIAFIINVPMKVMEKRLFSFKAMSTNKVLRALKRPLSMVLTIILIVAIIIIVFFMIIPELINTISIINRGIPVFMVKVQEWLNEFLIEHPEITTWVTAQELDWQSITDKVFNFLRNGATSVLGSTFNIATSVFSGVFNFVLGFAFAIYVLIQKEKLGIQSKKFVYAYLPEPKADKVVSVTTLSNRIFSNFITGQCTEAVILGVLCFIGMSIFKFPYAVMISVLVGFTALIPVFGAFIGCIVGAFLILVTDPMKAIWFVVFFLVLQQIEGNLIYPRVVGNSIGLPGIWVLVAVAVGGSMYGVLGMLVGVPLSSVIYALLRESVGIKLEAKRISKKKLE